MPFNPQVGGGQFSMGGGDTRFAPDAFQQQGARIVQAQLGGDWQAGAAKVREMTRGPSSMRPTSSNTTPMATVIPFPSGGARGGDPMGVTPGAQTGAVIGTALLMANEDTSGGGKLGEVGEQGFMPPLPPMTTATPVSSESEWANPYGSGPGAPPAAPPPSIKPPSKLPVTPSKSRQLDMTPFFVLAALIAYKLLK